MKKYFELKLFSVFILSLLTIAFFSCSKDENIPEKSKQIVRLTTDKLTLEVGEGSVLKTSFIPAISTPSENLKWDIVDSKVAEITVNKDFSVNVVAKAVGQTKAIVSSLEGKKYAICDVVVIPVPNPTVQLNVNEGTIFVGGNITLIPTFTPPVNRLTERYKWEAENTQVAELVVNNDFSVLVNGKAVGQSKVYLKTKNGDKPLATATVNVIPEPVIGELKNPVFINFGNATGVPAEWNTLSSFMAGATISDLKDKELKATGVSITITERFNGANETGEATTTTEFNMPSSVSKTAFFGNARADWGGLFKQGVFKFEGLNKNKKYDFCFFGSRSGVGDNREAKYIVKGNNEVSTSLNGSSNKTAIACAGRVQPDANGVIIVTVTMGDNNNNGTGFFYLNAMRIKTATE